ncbi:AAA family ATPase [Acetobacterium sp.]|uniref:AAA family ATPase n=1 Tax=Acetobacterium sp. TaxID=1872094 RepID=UPI00359308D7
MTDDSGNINTIETVESGGSSTVKTVNKSYSTYILQSRRFIDYEFGKGQQTRDEYLFGSNKLENRRSSQLNNFYLRLFTIQDHKAQFDGLLIRILGSEIKWTIDQNDTGNYFIKYTFNGVSHSSEGLGDGIWSIFTICDALYDSSINDTIVIDEPELSIHPSIQKRLMQVLTEESKTKQIILSTHSPYFVDWQSISNGANLIRTTKETCGNIRCYSLSDEIKQNFKGLISDLNNPHVLGLNANEVFFLEDKIILVEGQEDIVIFRKISDQLDKNFNGNFFGWGVGGVTKMKTFLELFSNLGFEKVVAIYDGDKIDEMDHDKTIYTNYKFVALCTDDIRDKNERPIQEKKGLTDTRGKLKVEHQETAIDLIDDINKFFV